MRRLHLLLPFFVLAAILFGTGTWALAQTGSAKPTASAAPTSKPSATPAASTAPSAAPSDPGGGQMPPGHPPTGGAPPGHPPTGGQQGKITDRVVTDKRLPPGTVAVMIIDGDDRPVPNIAIELAVLFSSVTKGETRESVAATTDENGQHTFNNLKYGSGVSYRVITVNGIASFSSQAFGLTDQAGVRVLQHRYEAVSSIAESRMLFELHLVIDVKQDNVALNHLLVAVNLGKEAYVANDVRIPFPEGYQAFSAQESMDGIGMVERDGAMLLQGTFAPGQTQFTYRYQMPLEGGDELRMQLPVPPRIAASRVVLKANEQMTLEVAGFPPAQRGRFNDGSKVHEAHSKAPQTLEEIQAAFSRNAPGRLDLTVKGIPNPGLKRTVAVLLALLAMALGAFHLFQRSQRTDTAPDVIEDLQQAKTTLLDELTLLEKLRKKGEVGPRTYQGLRTQLLDALARIMFRLDATAEETDADDVDEDGPRKRKKGKRRKRVKRKKRAAAASS